MTEMLPKLTAVLICFYGVSIDVSSKPSKFWKLNKHNGHQIRKEDWLNLNGALNTAQLFQEMWIPLDAALVVRMLTPRKICYLLHANIGLSRFGVLVMKVSLETVNLISSANFLYAAQVIRVRHRFKSPRLSQRSLIYSPFRYITDPNNRMIIPISGLKATT